nr:unnamed protein product [Callosobruchus analis]
MHYIFQTFVTSYTEGEASPDIVDETLLLFVEGLRLCSISRINGTRGYTYDVKIYCGREKVVDTSLPTNNLCEPLLNCGIYVDNYYTSVELAHKLLEKKLI